MLMELIIFAVVLVLLQTLCGVIMFKIVTSEKFMMKYLKTTMKASKEMTKELFEEMEL